jgi:hypothetical protein
VNDYPEKKTVQRLDEMDRYFRLWADLKKVHFKKMSFEEFCEAGPGCLSTAPDYDWQTLNAEAGLHATSGS